MATLLPRPERLIVYRRIIRHFLERFSQKRQQLHVPSTSPPQKPYSGMLSHLTPELFLQAEGSTEFACPSDRFFLKKGELALIPRGVPHGEKARQGTKAFQVLVICFHGNQLTLIVSKKTETSEIPEMDFYDSLEGPEGSTALRYLDDIAAIPENSPTSSKQREALIFAALASIHDLLLSPRLEYALETGHHPKVAQCRGWIRVYLNNPRLSASDLARQMGCTADHLSRCFRREMNMSLLEYLRQERMRRACDLLQDPNLNISEIAWACGFNSLNYFVRSFRQLLGSSPGKYRRNLGTRTLSEGEAHFFPPAHNFPRIRSKTSSGRSAFKTGRPMTT